MSPQIKAYNDYYINNKNSFDWIAFYDIDEYLYLKNYKNTLLMKISKKIK